MFFRVDLLSIKSMDFVPIFLKCLFDAFDNVVGDEAVKFVSVDGHISSGLVELDHSSFEFLFDIGVFVHGVGLFLFWDFECFVEVVFMAF